jgi:hypothetical protein
MAVLKVACTLLEPLLGTVPDRKVYEQYIESKRPPNGEDREVETVDDREERGWTRFHTDEHGLFLYDYQIKGAIKELSRIAYPKDNAAGLKAVQSKIELFVYVRPRRVYLGVTERDDVLERPLRAQTQQGPRVTVVRSDTVAAGRKFSFEVHLLPGPITEAHIRTVLALGEYRGFGQFRNGGYGRFTFEAERA